MRQVAGGMECAECARNLRIDVGQLDRVNATDASWNRRILTVSFRAGSHATLEELRAVVRRHHFTVREAEIVARGRVGRTPSGGLQLTITGSDAVYDIASAAARRAGRDVRRRGGGSPGARGRRRAAWSRSAPASPATSRPPGAGAGTPERPHGAALDPRDVTAGEAVPSC